MAADGGLRIAKEAPKCGRLYRQLTNRRPVELVRVNLRTDDSYGMCAYVIKPGAWFERNVLGSVLLAVLGADLQAVDGPVAVVGWIPATGEADHLPVRFLTMVEHMHARVVAALVNPAAGARDRGWDSVVCSLAKVVEIMPTGSRLERRISDFFGRDRTPLRWYACPNKCCAHGGLFHDRHSPGYDDARYQCCIDRCPCGKEEVLR